MLIKNYDYSLLNSHRICILLVFAHIYLFPIKRTYSFRDIVFNTVHNLTKVYLEYTFINSTLFQ